MRKPGSLFFGKMVSHDEDCLEVTSPGRLSPDLSMEQLKTGNSRMRNIAIGDAFQYMRIIERCSFYRWREEALGHRR